MLFLWLLISNSSGTSLFNCYLSYRKINCWNWCQNHFCMLNATDLTSRSSGKKQLEYVTNVFSNSKERNMLSFWDKHFNCKANSVFKLSCNQPIHLYLKKNIHTCGNRYCVQRVELKLLHATRHKLYVWWNKNACFNHYHACNLSKRMLVNLANMIYRSWAGNRFWLSVSASNRFWLFMGTIYESV